MARAYNHLDSDETVDFYRQASNAGRGYPPEERDGASGRGPFRADGGSGRAASGALPHKGAGLPRDFGRPRIGGGNYGGRGGDSGGRGFSRPRDDDDERCSSRSSDEGSELSGSGGGVSGRGGRGRGGNSGSGYNDVDDARSDRSSGRGRDGYNDFDDARSDRSSGRGRDGYSDFDGARSDRSSGRGRDDYNDFDGARSDRSNGRGRDGYNDFDDARSDRSGRSRDGSGGGSDGGSGGRNSGRHGGRNNRGGYRGDDASAGPFREDSRSGRSGSSDSRGQSSNGRACGKGDQWYYGEFADGDRSSGGHGHGSSNSSSGGGSGGSGEGASLLAGAGGGQAVRLAAAHAQGSPCGYLVLALGLMAAGVAGGQLFAASNVVQDPHLSLTAAAAAAGAAPGAVAGFTWLELAGLAAQTVLLPGGLCVLVLAASQATTHGAWSPRRKAATFGSLAAGCAAGSGLALWADGTGAGLVGCFAGPQLCAGSQAAKRGGASGFALFTGAAYACLGLPLALLFAKLATHAMRPAPSASFQSGGSSPAGTKEPLHHQARSGLDLEADAQSSSDRHATHQRLAAWERRARAAAAVAALLLLLLPLAVLACAFFPSQLEQVDAWEVDRKAAVYLATGPDQGAEPAADAAVAADAAASPDGGGGVGDSGGASDAAAVAASAALSFAGGAPLLTVRVSRFLSLTLTLDVAFFYGALYLVVVVGAFARACPPAQACLAAPPARGLVLWHPASKPRAGADSSSSGSRGGSAVLWKPSDGGGVVGTGGVSLFVHPAGAHGGSWSERLSGAALAVLWPPSIAATMGEWLLLLLLTALLLAEFSYWFLVFPFPCASAACLASGLESVPAVERLARALGQVGCCVMGLLVLPVARNSLLAPALGVSWDKAVAAHTFLGYLFLATALGHQLAWWAAERTAYNPSLDNEAGLMTSALFPFPFSAYDPNNWAVPLQAAVVWGSFLVVGVLSLAVVRRRAWDLFHFAHHFSLALFVATLWHARGAWQYVGAGLCLWLLDRLLRVGGNARRVVVHRLAALPTDDSPQDSDVGGFGDDDSSAASPCSHGAPLAHAPTQFVLLNVPALSAWEWHPVSISSAPSDAATTHHVKARGRGSWSGRLLALARQTQAPYGPVGAAALVVKVEGPYGCPPAVRRRAAVLLVAGGIGATPLHALFRSLYLGARAAGCAPRGCRASQVALPALVRLVWVAPDERPFDLFLDTLHQVMVDDLDGRFSFRLHATKARRPGYTQGAGDGSSGSGGGGRRGRRRDRGQAVPQLPFEPGRPALDTEFRRVEQLGGNALVYCCGPASLQRDCQALAHAAGVQFRADGFEL